MIMKTMYLISIEDNAIIACFFEYQLIKLLFSIKIQLNVDFWLFLFLTQSESKQFSIHNSFFSLYIMPQFYQLFKYLKIVFITFICQWLDFLTKWLITEVAKAISDCISTIKNMINLIIFWYFSSLLNKAWILVLGKKVIFSFMSVFFEFA